MAIPPHYPQYPPIPMSASSPRQAALTLDFIIVGGNIGGLACAYALASAGHRVQVLERATKDAPTSWSGLRVPPNLSKILRHWGLGEEHLQKSYQCRNLHFNDVESGERMGRFHWKDEIIEETGGDWLFMHHQDLYDMLYRIATEAGAKIIYGANVIDVVPGAPKDEGSEHSFTSESTPSLVMSQSTINEDDDHSCLSVTGHGPPTVVLESGEILTADIVVGVDGSESLVRNIILRPEDDHGRYTGLNIFTTTYTKEQLESDPGLSRLVNEPIWDIWMGDNRSVVGYPVGNRGEYALHTFWTEHCIPPHERPEDQPDWTGTYPYEPLAKLAKLNNYDPILQKLSQLPSQIARTKYIELPRCERWVHESKTIALMGEAAHPNVPCSNQSAGMVVEDAAVFGALFSRLRSWDQVPSLMEAYQDIRQPRTEFVAVQDLTNAQLCWIGPGPERDARNEVMLRNSNQGVEAWDDKMLQDQWDSFSEVFAYDALDAAADWWVGWGLLGEMAKRRTGTRDRMEISVSIEAEAQLQGKDSTPVKQFDA